MFRKNLVPAVLVVALLCSQLAFGWGDEGHQLINRTAATHLPATMPAFMLTPAAIDHLTYLGPEPDRWRNKAEASLKYAQEPEHFIDMERTEGIGELPIGRFRFIQKMYEFRATMKDPALADLYLPEKVGFQPYVVAEVYGRLKVAFREYRRLKAANLPTAAVEQDAIHYAGWLGHYVADGANPLHTTVQYNGWTGPNPNNYTTSHDIHWRFESEFVKANFKSLDLAPLVKEATSVQDEWKDYQTFLRGSLAQVEPLYKLEKTGAFTNGGTPDGVTFLRARMAAGAQMLANLWYSAWVESEKPVQNPF